MEVITDQLGRLIHIRQPPLRTISLVPSITELLFYLNLENHLVGITQFCTEPVNKVDQIKKIGGTKTPKMDLISSLHPDLIIANKEENRKEHILTLTSKFSVYISDVNELDDALQLIEDIGRMTDRLHSSLILNQQISRSFEKLHKPYLPKLRVLYLIWHKPYMAASTNTFIHAILKKAGWVNAAADLGPRYPQVTIDQLIQCKPDLVLLSSEPFKFEEKHRTEIQELIPLAKAVLVDGRSFSWYGSRLLKTPDYLMDVISSLD